MAGLEQAKRTEHRPAHPKYSQNTRPYISEKHKALCMHLAMLFPVRNFRRRELSNDERATQAKVLLALKSLNTEELYQACSHNDYPLPTGCTATLLTYLLEQECTEGATYVLEQIASKAESNYTQAQNPLRLKYDYAKYQAHQTIHKELKPSSHYSHQITALELAMRLEAMQPNKKIYSQFITRFKKLAPKNYQAIMRSTGLDSQEREVVAAIEREDPRSFAIALSAEPCLQIPDSQEYINFAHEVNTVVSFGSETYSCAEAIAALKPEQYYLLRAKYPDQSKGVELLPLLLSIGDIDAALLVLDKFVEQRLQDTEDQYNPLLVQVNKNKYGIDAGNNIVHTALYQGNWSLSPKRLEFIKALASKAGHSFAKAMLMPNKQGLIPMTKINSFGREDLLAILTALTKSHAPTIVNYGQVLQAQDRQGNNLMHHLITNGNPLDLDSMLMLAECDKNFGVMAKVLCQANNNGNTPIHLLMARDNEHSHHLKARTQTLKAIAQLWPKALVQSMSMPNHKSLCPIEQIPGNGDRGSIKYQYIRTCLHAIEDPVQKIQMADTLLKLRDTYKLRFTRKVSSELRSTAHDTWRYIRRLHRLTPETSPAPPPINSLHPDIQHSLRKEKSPHLNLLNAAITA